MITLEEDVQSRDKMLDLGACGGHDGSDGNDRMDEMGRNGFVFLFVSLHRLILKQPQRLRQVRM